MEKRITFAQKLFYGQGCLGQNVVNLAVVTWIIYFFAGGGGREPLIPIALAGFVLGIGRIIDIFTDPLIGYWSDRSNHKMGRRRPFILYGTPLLGLSFYLLWIPPVAGESWWNVLWLFVFINFFFLMLTATAVPYRSVIPEIAPDSRERISVSAWMAVFGTVGVMIASIGSGPVIASFGYPMMGLILGLIVMISFWLSLLGVKEKPKNGVKPETSLSFKDSVIQTLKNTHFLAFAAAIVSFQVGFQVFMIALPFFVTVILGEGEAQVAIYQGAFIVVMIAALPLWSWIGNRIGKRKGQLLSLLLVAILYPLYFFVGNLQWLPANIQAIAYFAVLAFPVSGLYVFPNAIVGDITDYDELKTNNRREAAYYAGFGFMEKAAWAISAFLVSIIFPVFGFTIDNPLGIRLVGPIVGAISILGFLGFRYYRLPDTIQGKTLEEIEGSS